MKKKKYFVYGITCALVLSCMGTNTVFAEDLQNKNVMNVLSNVNIEMTEKDAQTCSEVFGNMSDVEFDKTITELVKNARNEKMLIEKLEKCGVELSIGEKGKEEVDYQEKVMNLSNMDMEMTKSEIQTYSEAFQSMSNVEFDKTIAKLARETESKDLLADRLAQCGVEFSVGEEEPEISTNSLELSDINVDLYVAKRAGDPIYHLIADLTFDIPESFPGSQDALVIYFDSDVADYEETVFEKDSAFSLQSSIDYKRGYIVLNFDDEYITDRFYSEDYIAAVYVDPKKTGKLMYGAQFSHSYTTVDVEISGSVSVTLPNIYGGGIGFTARPGEKLLPPVAQDNYVIIK